MIWSVYFGAAAAVGTNAHLRIEMLIDAVSPRVRHLLDGIAQLWVLAFSLAITYAGYSMVRRQLRLRDGLGRFEPAVSARLGPARHPDHVRAVGGPRGALPVAGREGPQPGGREGGGGTDMAFAALLGVPPDRPFSPGCRLPMRSAAWR